jgi:DNA-directed RNA polymerase subunit N (RpoN/RPB10)
VGVYDTVMVPCPTCGERVGFQSKSGSCLLETFMLEEAPDTVLLDVNRHAPIRCDKCGTLFAVDVSGNRPKRTLEARSIVWKDEG